jgi:hypothetical protein
MQYFLSNKSIDLCDICKNNDVGKFVTFDIESQLKRIIKNPTYLSQIISANERGRRKQNTELVDLIDGEIYKNALKNISPDGNPTHLLLFEELKDVLRC